MDMKKNLCLIVMLFFLPIMTLAQNYIEKKEQPFRFIYLVHDHTSPVSTLINTLRDVERRARQYNQKCLIYMANGKNYYLAQINTENDNRDKFEQILGELNNKLSHDINIQADIVAILDLFKEHQIVDENGELIYKSVAMEFYLTSHFCDNGYAKDFIVPLYLAFDVKNMPAKFNFEVFVNSAGNEDYDYSGERIFGNKNYNSINEKVMIMDY